MGRPYTYQKNRALLKARTQQTNDVCARCGKPFDWECPWWYAMAFTAGHIVDIVDGGTHELDNLQPEHHRCNTSAGARKGIAIAQARGLPSNVGRRHHHPSTDPKSQEWP